MFAQGQEILGTCPNCGCLLYTSEKQLMHVTNSEPGSGLILFDNVVIPFVDKYPADTKTFAIMNTKPEESVTKEDGES